MDILGKKLVNVAQAALSDDKTVYLMLRARAAEILVRSIEVSGSLMTVEGLSSTYYLNMDELVGFKVEHD